MSTVSIKGWQNRQKSKGVASQIFQIAKFSFVTPEGTALPVQLRQGKYLYVNPEKDAVPSPIRAQFGPEHTMVLAGNQSSLIGRLSQGNGASVYHLSPQPFIQITDAVVFHVEDRDGNGHYTARIKANDNLEAGESISWFTMARNLETGEVVLVPEDGDVPAGYERGELSYEILPETFDPDEATEAEGCPQPSKAAKRAAWAFGILFVAGALTAIGLTIHRHGGMRGNKPSRAIGGAGRRNFGRRRLQPLERFQVYGDI